MASGLSDWFVVLEIVCGIQPDFYGIKIGAGTEIPHGGVGAISSGASVV